jgi:hypothetical protein
MATSTIEKVTNNSGTNYCKMPDGTMICWGYETLTGSGPFYTFTFGHTFVGAPNVQITTETSNVIFRVPSVSADRATAMVVSGTVPSEGSVIKWLTIGRWK